jgi:hypothetical protein
VHALDPKYRRFWELSLGRHTWQLWPPKSVLNHETEWTVKSSEEWLELSRFALDRWRDTERAKSSDEAYSDRNV